MVTKSIPVEIGIVWFCVSDIHSECIAALHNSCDVAHHAHSVKCRLTIEEDRISVHHMSVNNIAFF